MKRSISILTLVVFSFTSLGLQSLLFAAPTAEAKTSYRQRGAEFSRKVAKIDELTLQIRTMDATIKQIEADGQDASYERDERGRILREKLALEQQKSEAVREILALGSRSEAVEFKSALSTRAREVFESAGRPSVSLRPSSGSQGASSTSSPKPAATNEGVAELEATGALLNGAEMQATLKEKGTDRAAVVRVVEQVGNHAGIGVMRATRGFLAQISRIPAGARVAALGLFLAVAGLYTSVKGIEVPPETMADVSGQAGKMVAENFQTPELSRQLNTYGEIIGEGRENAEKQDPAAEQKPVADFINKAYAEKMIFESGKEIPLTPEEKEEAFRAYLETARECKLGGRSSKA